MCQHGEALIKTTLIKSLYLTFETSFDLYFVKKTNLKVSPSYIYLIYTYFYINNYMKKLFKIACNGTLSTNQRYSCNHVTIFHRKINFHLEYI